MSAKSAGVWVACAVMASAAVISVEAQASNQTRPGGQMAAGQSRSGSQGTTQSLGSARLPQQVTANGQSLPAGSYTLRLSNDAVTPVVGQPAGTERWVEFVQGGQVKGKELASVVTAAEVKEVAKMAPPSSGSSKVQTLKGADYLRVWLNSGGTHYLVHLTTGAAAPAKSMNQR
ncbi:MAG: hypothetical protein ABI051_18410 [Vicinamibacterales bacterium]